MSLFFADLVREVSHGAGAGDLALEGALPGHRRFADVVPPGARFHYAIAGITHPNEWETGEGELGGGGALARAPLASSAGGAAVNFAAGLKTVALTVAAAWFEGQEEAIAIDDVAGLAAALAGKAASSEVAALNAALAGKAALAGAAFAGAVSAPSLAVAGDADVTGDYRVDAVKVVGNRRTGWGAPTGTASRATFETSGATVGQLAQRLKALIDDLIAHGLIGA
ncbi:MAG TPA: hypothetical protein VGW40_02370 [Allosphingosinicella sp.]|nr:hypothetical protein [Allosphingosinicella sp.]